MKDVDAQLIWESWASSPNSTNYTDSQQQYIQRQQRGSQAAQVAGIDQTAPSWYDEAKGGPWDNLSMTRKQLFIQYGENMQQISKGRKYEELDQYEKAELDQYYKMLDKEYQRNHERIQARQ
tara:strand:+ start:361 stop:726 length:366 start_codon:yes stop_codon:yes gene_type:complete